MDKLLLGQRIAQAREDLGMTQEGLGRAVGLDRSAISRLENGERRLNVPELVEIAVVLGRPLAYFVADPVPAAVSRRNDIDHAHDTNRRLDVELDQFASDLRGLMAQDLLRAHERMTLSVPQAHADAEKAAAKIRAQMSLGSEPILDLGSTCEELGLFNFAAALGENGADGGCVEVEDRTSAVGAAVINGDAAAGRRRMTLAHELGHWIFGDAYDAAASTSSEQMINSFAIHFLAPRPGVTGVWNEHKSWTIRDRALAVGAEFRLSWSAAVSHLRNLELIDYDQYRALNDDEPRRGDYLRLGLGWTEELAAPYLSPMFTAAVLNAYLDERLTGARALELLRGTLSADQLPQRTGGSTEDLRRSFADHDD